MPNIYKETTFPLFSSALAIYISNAPREIIYKIYKSSKQHYQDRYHATTMLTSRNPLPPRPPLPPATSNNPAVATRALVENGALQGWMFWCGGGGGVWDLIFRAFSFIFFWGGGGLVFWGGANGGAFGI